MSAKRIELPDQRPSLRLWSEDPDVDELPISDETLRQNPMCIRTTDPASHLEWPLRSVLSRYQRDWAASRKESTWDQYQTLLRYWERFFGAPGPCVSTLSPEDLQRFFESVEEWGTSTTWQRNAKQLGSLLKTACRQTHSNRLGLPTDVAAPLKWDDLPFVEIPPESWFKSNRTAGAHRSGGHSPNRRSTCSLEEFQRVIDAIWSPSLRLRDRVWWETLFAWIWFSGMRITQAREDLRWCLDGKSEGIDLGSKSIVTTDAKCGGEILFPLPECLIPGLSSLWHRKRDPQYAGAVFLDDGHLSPARFRVWWNRIWQHAIPVETETEKELRHFNPHRLRSVSTTNWDLRPPPDNSAGWLITGHRPPDVRTASYFRPGDARLREIVNRFPMPRLHAGGSLFV